MTEHSPHPGPDDDRVHVSPPHDDHDHDHDHEHSDHEHSDHEHSDHEHSDHEHSDHEHSDHEHSDHEHDHAGGVLGWIRSLVAPHSHDTAESVDDALTASSDGVRALELSLGVLGVAAILQAVVFALSSSVGLLADTIHNFSDALTAIPLGFAFWLGRRAPTRRYTYGYGRAEDLAGIFIVVMIAASSGVAAWEAIDRLVHPRPVHHLALVAAAGVIGFAGNELAARFRISTGRRIGSAALVADGLHARTDGFTSLAVVLGAAGVWAGWARADAVVGGLISIAILRVLLHAAQDIYRRLMDSVDPALVDAAEQRLAQVEGVLQVDLVRLRWIGHELHAEAELTLDADLSLAAAHDIAEKAQHNLLHAVRRLTDVIIHVSPAASGVRDPHERTAHHPRRLGSRRRTG